MFDDDLQQALRERAIALDDKQRIERERWERRKAQYFPKNAQEVPEVVYKRYEYALQQPERPALMDATASAPWNRWLDNRISEYMDIVSKDMTVLADTIADELGTMTGRMERELRGEIAKLRAEIEILRKGGGNG
jgi:hypothetical protein